MKGMELLTKILETGLELYVYRSRRLLTKDSINEFGTLITTVVELWTGHEYSAKLQERLHKAWVKKREVLAGGRKISSKAPAWIDAKINPKTGEIETWKVIPHKAAIVKEMYQLAANGWGITAILKKFVREKVPPVSKAAWCTGNIQRMLHSRQVLGEYQPCKIEWPEGKRYKVQVKVGEPIKDYYPRIISDELFYRVQAKFNTQRGKKKTAALRNLFGGVAYCTCGAKMAVMPGRHTKYYRCYNHVNGTCKVPAMRYDRIESEFKELFTAYAHELIKEDHSPNVEAEVLDGKILELQKEIDFWVKAGSKSKKSPQSILARIEELERELEETKSKRELLSGHVSNGKRAKGQVDHIVKNLESLATNEEIRIACNDWVLSNFKRIVFDGRKDTMLLHFKSGQAIPWDISPALETNEEYYDGV